MNPIDAIPLALLGGLLGLDVVTFPQAMISRPIVASTIAGAFVGDPMAGLWIGALLELIALEMLPFGASKYPEWGSASVVGGALFALSGGAAPGAMAASLFAALLTATVSGWSMIRLRRLNGSRTARVRAALEQGSGRAVADLQIFGLTADFVRGWIVTYCAILLLVPLVSAILSQWSVSMTHSRAFVVAIAGAISAGAIWKVFHTVPLARAFFALGALLAAGIIVSG